MNPEILDQDALMERVGGDVEFLQEIAGVFVEDCPRLLEEIRRAVDRADARALEHAAHTLKGAVANFGGEMARQASFQLERMGRAGDLRGAAEAYASLECEIQRFNQALNALSAALSR